MSGPIPMSLAEKFVRYVLTGGSAAIVDVGLFAAFYALGLGAIAAAMASWLAAAVVNYTLSSLIAFRTALGGRRLLVFLLVAAAGFAINVSVTSVCALVLGVPPVLSKVIGIGIAFVANFLANAFLVFAPDRKAA